MRINKYLALCGVGSRRKVEELVLQKRVKKNGEVVESLSTQVDEKHDVILLDDNRITLTKEYVYYMLHKPKGYLSTVSDDRGRKTVMDLMAGINERIFPIGRLDYDSEGLLLFTNDGDTAQSLLHPSNEVEKTYVVVVCGEIKESELAVLRAGVVIDGRRTAKCRAKLVKMDKEFSRLEMSIHEGRNRQIRKMFEAIGKEVVLLKRVSVGKIKLGGLSRGSYRSLNQNEVDYLVGLALS